LVIVLFAVVALAAMCIRWPACRFGALWFFFGIADTLPVFPARNILAADRYMYLPIIGLFWCLAAVAVNGYSAVMARRSPAVRIGFAGGVALVAAALIGTSWHTAKWYNSALLKTQRVVECFPNEPRVWEKLGWTHHQLGHYDKALECAEKEMKQENPAAVSGACQLMGMSHLRLGNKEEALHWLHRAVDLDPSTDIGKYRLALAYEELERLDEAVKYYELAVQAAPGHNPTLLRLAALYARTDRLEHARRTYEKALHNNAYEVPAVIGLVELDIKQDDPASLLTAEKRLLNVLDDLPENTPLRVNLGVVRYARGRVDDAIDIYSTVLSDEPDESTAAINLAQIVLTTDEQRSQRAELGLRQSRADHAVVAAAQVLGSHFEGRFSEAMRQLPPVLRQTAEAAQARTLLLAALQRFDERRPDVASTYALTAELLIADGQSDAAHAFLGLLESTCRESSCQSHILKLRERLFMRGDQGGS
jgi:tetratricopeptide (TPR) repeat protein